MILVRNSFLLGLGFLFVKTSNSQVYFYQDIVPDKILNTWSAHDIHIDSSATSTLVYGDQGNLTIWEDFGTQVDINAFSNCEVMLASMV